VSKVTVEGALAVLTSLGITAVIALVATIGVAVVLYHRFKR